MLCEGFAVVSFFKCLDTLYVHFSAMMLLVEWHEGHSACKKNWVVGVGMVTCPEQGADLHTAQLMPLLSLSLSSVKSRLVFTFLIPAHLGSPGKRPRKNVCTSRSLMILEYAVAQLVVAYACRCQCSVSEERS